VKLRCLERLKCSLLVVHEVGLRVGYSCCSSTIVPFDVGHSTLPSALDLDPSTLRSALVALIQSSVLLACFCSSSSFSVFWLLAFSPSCLGRCCPATAVTAGCSCGSAAALRGCSVGGSYTAPAALAAPVGALFWLLLRALLLAASAVLFSATPLGALVGCVNWGTFLPASEDAPTMAASSAAIFT